MMKGRVLTFILLAFHLDCVSQRYFLNHLELGEAYFERKEYAFAIPHFKKCIKADKNKEQPIARLGECYFHLKKWKEAQRVFHYLSQQHPENHTYSKTLATLYLKLGEIKQARAKYASINDTSGLVLCDSISFWIKQPKRYKITPFKAINTIYSELSPIPYENGIVFCSNKEGTIIRKKSGNTGQPMYNLYYSDSSGKKAVPFSTLMNTFSDEGSVTFTNGYKKAYFSRSKVDKDNVTRLKLYSAEKKKLGWTFTQDFIFNDSIYSFGHPFVDKDDKLFFFISDMKGGHGGTDIYACVKVDSMWSNPINLGPMINTPGNEIFPFYSDEEMLYFSSNGRLGMGGYDIYRAEQKDGEWIKVENLGSPINSIADDYSIFIENQKGYFSSNRPGGKGLEDIYKFRKY